MITVVFPKLLGRIAYAVRWALWGAFVSVLTSAHSYLIDRCGATLYVQLPTTMAFVAAFLYLAAYVVRPRLKDLRASMWLLCLLIVPLANFIILLALMAIPKRPEVNGQTAEL